MIKENELPGIMLLMAQPTHEITDDYLSDTLGRKYKTKLSVLAKYTKLFDFIYPSNHIVYKPLSSHSTGLQKHLQCKESQKHQLLSKVLRELCDLDIIYKVSSEYHYQSQLQSECYCYFYRRERGQEFLDFIKKFYSKCYPVFDKYSAVKSDSDHDSESTFSTEIPIESISNIKITSKTRKKISDDEAMIGLLKQYPYLATYMSIANSINSTLQSTNGSPWSFISYYPHFYRSSNGNITKVSIRASSPISNKPKWSPDREYVHCRDYILDEEFGEWVEYDVKSSVPRVTYLLNHGRWIANSVDLYKLMFPELTDETRDQYKSLFMYLYFSPTKSSAIIAAHKKFNKLWSHSTIEKYYNQMIDTLGKSYGSEIFMHESNLYLLVRQELANLGINCMQVYDAFFYSKSSTCSIDKILSSVSQKYLETITTN